MPLPAALIPLIGGAVTGIATGIQNWRNKKAQESQNEKDRQFQKDMYAWSRTDAQTDWAREAEYNHPMQQMTRLRQAGLNPNLIYGKGADNTMGSIRAGTQGTGNQKAYQQTDNPTEQGLDKYYQIQNIQAQTDNLQQSVALSKQEELNKQAQLSKTLQETAMSKFQLGQAQELKDDVIRQAKLKTSLMSGDNLEQLQRLTQGEVKIDMMKQELMQMEELHPLKKQKLLAEIKLAQEDGRIREEEAKLRKAGVNPNDPSWLRMLLKGIMEPKVFDDLVGNLDLTKITEKQFFNSNTGKWLVHRYWGRPIPKKK